MSDVDRLRRLAVLALLAAAGDTGLNLPGLIAGLRVLTPDSVQACLNELQRKGLIRRSTRRHPDGDRDVVCYYVDPEVELAVNV
jgi:hypothetical protein